MQVSQLQAYKEGLSLAIPHVSLEQENITYIKCLAADKEIKLKISIM